MAAGFFQFHFCQTEASATPLFDVQVHPAGVSSGPYLQSITIVGFRPDDTVAPNYLGRYRDLVAPGTRARKNDGLVPVVALNCSGVPGCHMDGVSITCECLTTADLRASHAVFAKCCCGGHV